MSNWQRHLEIVGAELFQEYRKRLLLPGIAMQIRADYPGLSILDVLVRVHAGRKIIRDGDDFRALRAIRYGSWHFCRVQNEPPTHAGSGMAPGDRFSRFLVILGGALFVGFCLGPVHTNPISTAGAVFVSSKAE